MNVYDEYVKSQGGPAGEEQSQQVNGATGGDENHQPAVEEVKDAEA